MTRFLLDVNVLIALLDPMHLHHDRVHKWFAAEGSAAWATCPHTENGVLRIVGHPRYSNSTGTPAVVAEVLQKFRKHAGHAFWPDDLSLLDNKQIQFGRLLHSAQVTDTYLLALAVAHGGALATLDTRLITDAVVRGAKALHHIP